MTIIDTSRTIKNEPFVPSNELIGKTIAYLLDTSSTIDEIAQDLDVSIHQLADIIENDTTQAVITRWQRIQRQRATMAALRRAPFAIEMLFHTLTHTADHRLITSAANGILRHASKNPGPLPGSPTKKPRRDKLNQFKRKQLNRIRRVKSMSAARLAQQCGAAPPSSAADQALLRAAAVPLEPFNPPQPRGIHGNTPCPSPSIHPQPGPHPQERQHTQPASETCSSASGQNVVGSDPVVAEHLGRYAPDEQPAIVPEPACNDLSVPGHDLQVLGSERISNSDRLVEAGAEHRTPVLKRSSSSRRSRQDRQLLRERDLNPSDQPFIRTHQDRHGIDIMLRLCEQVCGHSPGISTLIRQDQQLRWTRQHVDPHLTRHDLLRCRDPPVAWPDNHIASWNALRAIRHGADHMRAADRDKYIRPSNRRGRERRIRGLGRCDSHHAHTSNPRSHRSHEHA